MRLGCTQVPSTVPPVKDKDDYKLRNRILPRDWHESGVAIICLIAGFAVAMLIFGWPFNLPPAWGDIPTWILALGAVFGGAVALTQLHDLRKQIQAESALNDKRDLLMDKQLESLLRSQALNVTVHFNYAQLQVTNNSTHQIGDITAQVMSRSKRRPIAAATSSGVSPMDVLVVQEMKPIARQESVRPHAMATFQFEGRVRNPQVPGDQDEVFVAWFTDDTGFRWQLDEFQHLVQSDDESVYKGHGQTPVLQR
jgi:hypothetical protein